MNTSPIAPELFESTVRGSLSMSFFFVFAFCFVPLFFFFLSLRIEKKRSGIWRRELNNDICKVN